MKVIAAKLIIASFLLVTIGGGLAVYKKGVENNARDKQAKQIEIETIRKLAEDEKTITSVFDDQSIGSRVDGIVGRMLSAGSEAEDHIRSGLHGSESDPGITSGEAEGSASMGIPNGMHTDKSTGGPSTGVVPCWTEVVYLEEGGMKSIERCPNQL